MAIGSGITEKIAASGSYQPASGVAILVGSWHSGGVLELTDGTDTFEINTYVYAMPDNEKDIGTKSVVIDNSMYLTETGGANPVMFTGIQIDA